MAWIAQCKQRTHAKLNAVGLEAQFSHVNQAAKQLETHSDQVSEIINRSGLKVR